MRKNAILTIVMLLTGWVGLASATEVISIDINNYGNDEVYAGEAAVPGATTWVAYYGGWGVPAGSPKSADLAPTGTIQASTYAEQVWLADMGGHQYITGAGDGLMDDGFEPNSPGVESYSLSFIGSDMFAEEDGVDYAYGGNFDIYVYGNSAGTFSLTDANDIVIADPISITGTTSGFVEGENYVVFEDVSIARPNSILLHYSNDLNGIQLVSNKMPVPIIKAPADPNDKMINAVEYDVAYDTNGRDDELNYGVGTYYGPDIADGVYLLHTNEFMEYDIVVDAANEGQYEISVDIDSTYGDLTLDLLMDDAPIGTLEGIGGGPETLGPVTVNLFAGEHTLKWVSGYSGSNIYTITFDYLGDITLNDCADVYSYGLQLAGDITGDCRVNLEDLALLAADWAQNNDPEAP